MDFEKVLYMILGVVIFLVITLQLMDYLFPWIKYDIKYFKQLIGIASMLKQAEKQSPIYTMVQKLVDQTNNNPQKPLVYYEDEVWTYQQINQYCNQVARSLNEVGIGINNAVAMLMHSSPKFIGVWFGIGKTGATSAFINYNIRGKSLLHCLRVSGCKAVVVENDPHFIKALEDIEDEISNDGITVYVLGNINGDTTLKYKSFNELLEKQSKAEVPMEWRKDLTLASHFCYVYTSGTTGPPKAALCRHDRALAASTVLQLGDCCSDDIVYSPLPMYHASAGMLGVLGTLQLGASIIVRKKYSASRFWEDCRKHKATVVQYIGETIRYVCNQPPKLDDQNHTVRKIIGNGLRPAVWKIFLDRFGKEIKVMEIYAATEGNLGFINLDNHFGSVGLLSPILKMSDLAHIIQYDKEKKEIVRNKDGWCVDVPNGTPGLLVTKITEKTLFHGYYGNKKHTESKILRNVFKKGDAFYNSGDMLRRDPDYHLYFIDRLADNFRWKGENVSTNEVADVISNAPSIKEANVYGVEINGYEGRAGMAVVILEDDNDLDCDGVYKHASDYLAPYARPLFLRIKKEIEITGTFKQKKVQLVKEGFNPENIGEDPIYYMDNHKKRYSPFTQAEYDDIINGKIRI